MRIAVLTSLYPTPARPHEGLFAEERWTRMAARGHAVRVVHPLPRAPRVVGPRHWREIASAPAQEVRRGIEVLRPRYWHLPGRARSNARAFAARGVRTIQAAERPDVVVADYAWPAAEAAWPLRAAGLPFVVHGRGSDVLQVAATPELRGRLASALELAGTWCAVSRDLLAAMDELGGRPGHGVLTPNGVDGARFLPRERAAARANLGLEQGQTWILVVGHLIERKDPMTALAAFAHFARTRSEARLAFIGRGPLRADLERRAAEEDLLGRVRFLGECEPDVLADWYAAGDALLLTSVREGRPNVVLEALASGRPVLATEAGGSFELLEGLPEGRARSRRPEDLARQLAELLECGRTPEELRSLVEDLSWDAGLDALEGVLASAERAAVTEAPR